MTRLIALSAAKVPVYSCSVPCLGCQMRLRIMSRPPYAAPTPNNDAEH
jgi:hypothetical protein